jgi:hypothetical protein
MQNIAVGRSAAESSSSASGREPFSEYAHGTMRQSSPQRRRDLLDGALGGAPGRGLDGPGQDRDPLVAERAEVAQRVLDAAVVVEDHLADGHDAREGVADRDRRHLLGDQLPAVARRPDGQDDEAVHAVVHEPPGEVELAGRLAVRVRDQRASLGGVKLPLHRPHELLVPEVREAAHQQPDHGGRPAAERPGDRIRLVPELLRRGTNALLGLGRDVHPAEGIAHRGR